MTDGRLARGERTRGAVLDAAVSMASVDGLEAMSLARLAHATEVSKSGLFAHWADKESLQLAVIAHAVHMWTAHVVTPAFAAPRGVRRLWALHERRMEFYASGTLPGGCFFVATEAELDDRPGPVRDALAAAISDWLSLIKTVAAQAVEARRAAPRHRRGAGRLRDRGARPRGRHLQQAAARRGSGGLRPHGGPGPAAGAVASARTAARGVMSDG